MRLSVCLVPLLAGLMACGGSSGGSGSAPATGSSAVSAQQIQAIASARSMSAGLRSGGRQLDAFWTPQGDPLNVSMKGLGLSLDLVGERLSWLTGAVRDLDASGQVACRADYDSGLWEVGFFLDQSQPNYNRERIWTYSLSRSGDSYQYCVEGPAEDGGPWSGTLTDVVRWSDGSLKAFRLLDATLPGQQELLREDQGEAWRWTERIVSKDRVDLWVEVGSDQSMTAVGSVQGTKVGEAAPTYQLNLASATWTQIGAGLGDADPRLYLPRQMKGRFLSGTYVIDGTIDFGGYQANASAAQAAVDGPVWGWKGLDASGQTFTRIQFAGEAGRTQDPACSMGLTLSLLNYSDLNLAASRSEGNALQVQSEITANPAGLNLDIRAKSRGLKAIDTTLDLAQGEVHITGQGTYFPAVEGQTERRIFTAELRNEHGVEFHLQEDLQGNITGTVECDGKVLGEIENVSNLGLQVNYIDGTSETLW